MNKTKKIISIIIAVMMILTAIPMTAFAADTDFVIDENGVLTAYNGAGGDIVIPDGVTSIGDEAFLGCTNLTSIEIPDSVTSIGNKAFESCENLASIEISDSIKSIGDEAFSYCVKLTSIEIPDGITSIGMGTFYSCIALKSITIPGSVTSIGDYAFCWCDSLSDVYFIGTEEQRNEMTIGSYNTTFVHATIHFIVEHEHIFDTEWTTNATAHWHECTAEDCDIEDYITSTVDGIAYGAHVDENGDFYCDICEYFDEAGYAADLDDYKAEIAEYYNTILDGDCSEAAKALAEEALDGIAAAADKDAVDAVNDEYYNKLDLQFDYEFALVDLLAALESDKYSDAVKAIIREDIAALGKAESTDELWEIYEEYDGKIGLQLMKEGVCAQLQEYIDAGASEAVKEIIADAVENINACETMNEVVEVYGAAEDAIAEQLKKETNLEAVREAAINEILAAAEVYVTTFDKALVNEALNVINAADNITTIETVKEQALDRLAKNVLEVDYESAVGVNNTYRFWVKDRANMIQLMELDHGDGTGTRSFDRYHDNVEIVSYNINFEKVPSTSKDVAFEIWTITTNLADGDIGVRVKEAGSPAWEDASNALHFENYYADADSEVISATPAKTEGGKGAVKATVVTGADATIVQLKNKEGETFTFDLSKATENEDGTLTFNCSVYFHGTAGTVNTATIRVCDVYGWHDSDVTFDYTIVK